MAGLAALLLAERGPMSPGALKDLIRAGSVDLGAHDVDPYFGAGRIDVKKALGL